MRLSVFEDLPLELLESILRQQEPARIAIFREVCRTWKNVVDNSPAILYAMKLAKYGLKENPVALPASAAERLVLLDEQVNSSWADMQPSLDAEELIIPSSCRWEFFGNVLAYVTDEKVVFHQVASPRSKQPRLTWEAPIRMEGPLGDFGMDPSQDLLILARFDTSPPALTLTFCTMSTGHAHPMAWLTQLTMPTHGIKASASLLYHISVYGAYVGILLKDVNCGNIEGFELFIVNWTTGKLCMDLQQSDNYELQSFAFISETHIVVFAPMCDPAYDWCEAGLRILNFLSGQTIVSDNDLFLKFHSNLQDVDCTIRCDPTPSWPGRGASAQFYDNPDELIYTIFIRHPDADITLVVRRASLLEHLGRGEWDIEWSDWGEQGATRVEIDDSDSCWEGRTFGSFMVTTDEKRTLTIYDFNQKRVRLLPEFLVDPFDNSAEGKYPIYLVPVWPNKSEDSENELEGRDTIEDESDWETESETSSDADAYDCIASLPFRKRVFPNILPTGRPDAIMGFDCILLVDLVDDEYRFRVLHL